jgi:hypothetical protein
VLSHLKDEPLLDLSFLSRSGDSIDAPNVSIEHADVLAGIDVRLADEGAIADIVAPSGDDTSFSSCESRGKAFVYGVWICVDWLCRFRDRGRSIAGDCDGSP